MTELNVLIVNPDERQSLEWSARLEKAGYRVVSARTELSGMIYALSHEDVHIILCTSGLIKDKAYAILNGVMNFFPRVKIVVIGKLLLPYALPRLTNVVIKQSFDCCLRELFSFPDKHTERANRDDVLGILLGEHFLTAAESAAMLEGIEPDWVPEFAVIGILADSNASLMARLLNRLAEKLPLRAVIKLDMNEVCAILDQSPDMNRCLNIADSIRLYLLQETNEAFSVGVSRSRSRADELFACRKEARCAARASHIYGRNSVIHISYMDENDIWYAYPHHKERRLIERALDGDSGGALGLLDELFLFLGNREDLRERYVNKIAMRIWTQMNLAASSRLKSFETAHMDSMSYGRLLTLKTHEDIYQFLKDGVVKLGDEMRELWDVRRDVLFVKLCELKDKGVQMTPSELTNEFHTTAGFVNDAIIKNCRDNIFDFWE